MAVDPFEGRLIFLQLLQRVNASVRSQQTAASFAISNPDLEEDLYSCILEELETADTNMKANILFFIETLCESSSRRSDVHYIQMISRDIEAIIDLTASSRANVSSSLRVLNSLVENNYISKNSAAKASEMLKQRSLDDKPAANENVELSKEEIMRRMEEDRERQKILRENIWAIPHPSRDNPNPEFSIDYETLNEWKEQDKQLANKEGRLVEELRRLE